MAIENEGEIIGELAALIERLPEGPAAGRLAVLVGLAVRASGLGAIDAWVGLAAAVSAAHGGAPACVRILDRDGDLSDEDEAKADSCFYTFHASGEIERTLAVVMDEEASWH